MVEYKTLNEATEAVKVATIEIDAKILGLENSKKALELQLQEQESKKDDFSVDVAKEITRLKEEIKETDLVLSEAKQGRLKIIESVGIDTEFVRVTTTRDIQGKHNECVANYGEKIIEALKNIRKWEDEWHEETTAFAVKEAQEYQALRAYHEEIWEYNYYFGIPTHEFNQKRFTFITDQKRLNP